MTEHDDKQDLFVDVCSAPDDWATWIDEQGIVVERSEPQPIADQVKLHKCTNLPANLPRWIRRGDMYLASEGD